MNLKHYNTSVSILEPAHLILVLHTITGWIH